MDTNRNPENHAGTPADAAAFLRRLRREGFRPVKISGTGEEFTESQYVAVGPKNRVRRITYYVTAF